MQRTKLHYISDGLLHRNPILVSGMIAAPVIACTDTVSKALLLCYAFDAITFLTVLISKAVPQRLPYALRILSYSLIASLVYIPTAIAADYLFPAETLGIYLPLLTVSLLVNSETEHRYERNRFLSLTGSLIFEVLGFDLVALLMGCIRELLTDGSLYQKAIFHVGAVPSAGSTAIGMILLGCLAAILRSIYPQERKEPRNDAADQ